MFRDRYPPPTPIAAPFSAPTSARTPLLFPVTFPVVCALRAGVYPGGTTAAFRPGGAAPPAIQDANFRINNLKLSLLRLIKGFGISSGPRETSIYFHRKDKYGELVSSALGDNDASWKFSSRTFLSFYNYRIKSP